MPKHPTPPVGEAKASERGRVIYVQFGRRKHDPIVRLPLDAIDADDRTFDFRIETPGFESLKRSIESAGQVAPVIVRRQPGGQRLQLISGFMRLAALRELGAETVLAVVRNDLDDRAALVVAVTSNTAWEPFSEIERAMMARAYRQHGHDTEEIAEVLGVSSVQVENLERLLELPEVAQQAVADPASCFGGAHARALARLAGGDDSFDWGGWIARCDAGGWSAPQLCREVSRASHGAAGEEDQFASLLDAKGTDLEASQLVFKSQTLDVSKLSRAELVALQAELELLLDLV